jgi:ribosomal protein S18 acetylase RimI-like enzyme
MAERFIGHVDTIEPALAGWVVDRQQSGKPVRFAMTVDRELRVPVVADRPRPDVSAAGFGGPNCGFEIALPAYLFDGRPHDVELVLRDGQRLNLPGCQSPIVLGPVAATLAPITIADLDATGDLLRRTHRESGMDAEAITDRYVANWIRSLTGAPGGLLIGAHVDQRLVGYAALEHSQGAAPAIGAVALTVLRQYRRKGLGERLMRALLALAREVDEVTEVWLSVAPQNLPALRLYEKLGFAYRAEPPSSLFVPATYLAMLWRPDHPGG